MITSLTTPDERTATSDRPALVFAARSAGALDAINVWFHAGDRVGEELIYPGDEARTIANASDRTVSATLGEH
ncbi:MAG: hypothetical protein ABJA98_30880 [Acidobacteriota bacterium]